MPVASGRLARLVRVAEARPALAIFVLALAVRVTVAAATFVLMESPLVPDEQQYVDLAAAVADGDGARSWSGDYYGEQLYRTTFAFTGLLARLFEVVPANRLAGSMVSAGFGAAVAAATVVIAGQVVARRRALAAGAVVALLPSQVIWSSASIRESMVWAGMAAVAFVVPGLGAARARAVGWVALGAGGLLALGWLREQTLVAAAWGLLLTGLVASGPRRRMRVAGAVLLAAMLPALGGAGPLGLSFARDRGSSLAERRTELSFNASSGFVPIDNLDPGEVPDDGRPVESDGRRFAVDESLGAHLRHLPKGLVAVLARPLPWDASRSGAFQLAKLENVAWIAMYLLALAGLPSVWRRRDVLAYPAFVIVTVVVIGAVTQGNVGTAFRHRGQILWALAILAVAGFDRLWPRRQVSDA